MSYSHQGSLRPKIWTVKGASVRFLAVRLGNETGMLIKCLFDIGLKLYLKAFYECMWFKKNIK
jgi:hypothetical protein